MIIRKGKMLAAVSALSIGFTPAIASAPNYPVAVGAVSAQSFPKIPKIPKLPRISTRRAPEPRDVAQENRAGNRELEREYSKETAMLAYPINTNWSSQADNARIEKAVSEYLARVDRVAGDRFDSLAQEQRAGADATLKAHYDTVAKTIDREIDWSMRKIKSIGVADSAYNDVLVLDAALHGAVTLYPDVEAYRVAKAKSAAALEKFGSRSGANEQKDAAIMAEARKVKMPRSIDNSSASIRQFRQAFATSGIPWTIKKIHITSGWGTKRNRYGVILGRTRDAAIAAQDPKTGKCNLYDFTMIIEKGGSPRRSSHSTKRIACENIPK